MSLPSFWPESAVSTLSLQEANDILGEKHSEPSDLPMLQGQIRKNIERYSRALIHTLFHRQTQEIFDGGNAKNLKESLRTFISPRGLRITAATDTGIGRTRNEDRVVVDTAHECYVAIDGVGGHAQGDKAAQLFAEACIEHGDNMAAIIPAAGAAFLENELHHEAGVCFMGIKITWDANGDDPLLDAYRAGDVRLLILNKDDSVAFESTDDDLVNLLLTRGDITEDQSHYHHQRHVVNSYINSFSQEVRPLLANFPLQPQQRLLLMTDGITDNILTEELLERIKRKPSEPERMSPQRVIKFISDITDRRMQSIERISDPQEIHTLINDREGRGRFIDGYKTKPKCDNRGIIIVDIP